MCYPLFQVQWDIHDQDSLQTLSQSAKGHHLYSGMFDLRTVPKSCNHVRFRESDEGYTRNASCALHLISTFLVLSVFLYNHCV